MRRRELLAGAAGLGALAAGGGYYLLRPTPDHVESVTLQGVEAPGSTGDTVQVPDLGRPSFVGFFATWCGTCESMMPEIAEAREQVDDVQFVSVTYERIGQTVSEEEVREWWSRTGGTWQIAHDSDYDASREFDVAGIPTSYVVNGEGEITWSDTGYHSADEIQDVIEEHGGR